MKNIIKTWLERRNKRRQILAIAKSLHSMYVSMAEAEVEQSKFSLGSEITSLALAMRASLEDSNKDDINHNGAWLIAYTSVALARYGGSDGN